MAATIDGSAGITTSASVTTGTGAVYNGIQSATAQNSTSGTSIDFTSIPSWVKRITVMFNGVSTSGSSNFLIQIGAGSVTTSGYSSAATSAGGTNQAQNSSPTAGLIVMANNAAANTIYGIVYINNITGNTWVSCGTLNPNSTFIQTSGGGIALGGTLDRVRITTVNGTDTFDAGSINILYE